MNIHLKRILFVGALAVSASCAGYVVPAGGFVYVERRPPPVRREVIIASPGPGHVWVAGRWEWRRNDYVWVPGAWVVIRTGYRRWIPGEWRHERRGWFWIEGHWA